MLPVMHRIAGDVFVFQQDRVPAHRARETVQLRQQCDAGACLQDSCRRRQSAETVSHQLVVKSVSGRHR